MELMIKKTTIATIVMILLISLSVVNACWLIVNWHGGPLIALAFYLIVSILCLRKQHFQAGIISGIIGFGIHLIDLIGLGTSQLTGITKFFFYMNLILPIPLSVTSYLAFRMGPGGPTDQVKS